MRVDFKDPNLVYYTSYKYVAYTVMGLILQTVNERALSHWSLSLLPSPIVPRSPKCWYGSLSSLVDKASSTGLHWDGKNWLPSCFHHWISQGCKYPHWAQSRGHFTQFSFTAVPPMLFYPQSSYDSSQGATGAFPSMNALQPIHSVALWLATCGSPE